MKRKQDTNLYRFSDFVMAMLAWACFYAYRKLMVEKVAFDQAVWQDLNFYYGIFLIPIAWILFYQIFDKYQDIYRLSRLSTLGRTFLLSFVGVIFLFFSLILDDVVQHYQTFFTSFVVLLSLHFTFTATARMLMLTWAHRRLKLGKVSFRTLIIGGGEKALQLYQNIVEKQEGYGYEFTGFVEKTGSTSHQLSPFIAQLGEFDELSNIIRQQEIEEVIIAMDQKEEKDIKSVLDTLYDFGEQIWIKIIPDMYDILLGSVKMNAVYGAVLIHIKQELMPKWQRLIKRLMDVTVSFLVLLILSPLYLFIIWKVKRSSEGPIFYKQERIGFNYKPFHIVKFRSMYTDAEKLGPQLSSENDPRITPFGITMRKYRLDELPNFWNVLVGDMSLVGPRPERQFFIDKIMEHAPHYRHLLKVRPGITSWGQVKYGYASNVEEMLQRLKFDILYIENMSLALDFKIIIYTVLVIIKGAGK